MMGKVLERPTREEIGRRVAEVLVEALAVDLDEVVEDARLVQDLQAESIDYLDITFRLEKEFGIRIPPYGRPFPVGWGEPEHYKDNRQKLTPEGIRAIRGDFPHLSFDDLEANPTIEEAQRAVTVGSVIDYLEKNWEGLQRER